MHNLTYYRTSQSSSLSQSPLHSPNGKTSAGEPLFPMVTSSGSDVDEAALSRRLRLRALFERERRRRPLKSALVTTIKPRLRLRKYFAEESFILICCCVCLCVIVGGGLLGDRSRKFMTFPINFHRLELRAKICSVESLVPFLSAGCWLEVENSS